MWTATTRRQHSRAGLRYDTDLTVAEWALVEPLHAPAVRGAGDRVSGHCARSSRSSTSCAVGSRGVCSQESGDRHILQLVQAGDLTRVEASVRHSAQLSAFLSRNAGAPAVLLNEDQAPRFPG